MSAEPGLPGPREAPDPARALPENSPPGPGRLLALSDGVVAIALTLLVLDLRVPAIGLLRHPDSASALAAQLGRDTDQLISYVVSFYVIAQFWLTHHRVFRVVTGHSEGLAWWNFAFLLAITLVPFTSGLLGLYAENPLAVDIFAANILLASLALVATTRFIQRKGLSSAAHDEEQARAGRIRAFSVAAIMLVSMAVAWWNADLAKYLWILIAFLPDIVIRATRRRPGPPPAAGTSRRLAGTGPPPCRALFTWPARWRRYHEPGSQGRTVRACLGIVGIDPGSGSLAGDTIQTPQVSPVWPGLGDLSPRPHAAVRGSSHPCNGVTSTDEVFGGSNTDESSGQLFNQAAE